MKVEDFAEALKQAVILRCGSENDIPLMSGHYYTFSIALAKKDEKTLEFFQTELTPQFI